MFGRKYTPGALTCATRRSVLSCGIVNLASLAKALLPGFLPLLAYVAAESLFGEKIGLAVGIALGAAEFFIVLARRKKADLFILADTALLALVGALSLALGSPTLFRLKPAAMEAPLALAMFLLASAPDRVLAGWLASQLRMMPVGAAPVGAVPLGPSADAVPPGPTAGTVPPGSGAGAVPPAMRRTLRALAIFLLAHAGLTAWAAFALPAAWWGFISGVLPYLALGVAALVLFLRARRAAPAAALAWSLHLHDGQGSLYAVRPGPDAPWDAAARGIARIRPIKEMDAAIRETLGREFTAALSALGVAGGADAVRVSLLTMPDGGVIAFAGLGPGIRPHGADPALRRFWRAADLASLRGSGALAPALERDLDLLADPALYGAGGARL